MPQLDIFIFFSQYFVFLALFLSFYIFVLKFLVKEIDYIEQLGKHKMVSLYNTAAILRMIFDKSNKKSKNFLNLGIQTKKNLDKNFFFHLLLQKNIYGKFSFVWLSGLKIQKQIIKFLNYLNK